MPGGRDDRSTPWWAHEIDPADSPDQTRPGGGRRNTNYFHLYDVTDLDHVRLLGAEVLPS